MSPVASDGSENSAGWEAMGTSPVHLRVRFKGYGTHESKTYMLTLARRAFNQSQLRSLKRIDLSGDQDLALKLCPDLLAAYMLKKFLIVTSA